MGMDGFPDAQHFTYEEVRWALGHIHPFEAQVALDVLELLAKSRVAAVQASDNVSRLSISFIPKGPGNPPGEAQSQIA